MPAAPPAPAAVAPAIVPAALPASAPAVPPAVALVKCKEEVVDDAPATPENGEGITVVTPMKSATPLESGMSVVAKPAMEVLPAKPLGSATSADVSRPVAEVEPAKPLKIVKYDGKPLNFVKESEKQEKQTAKFLEKLSKSPQPKAKGKKTSA